MNGMFSALGVLGVEHHTVTTNNFTATLKDFLSIPNSKLIRGPGHSQLQNAQYAFIELNGMGVVEVLSPLDANHSSSIFNYLKDNGVSYICYRVEDLDLAIAKAESSYGAKQLPIPSDNTIFDGRRTAFLSHPEHGTFKLLEALPQYLYADGLKNEIIQTEVNVDVQKLLEIFCSVVDTNAKNLSFDQISMETCTEWDSFKHLLLIMEVEKAFEVSITATAIGELNSLEKIGMYLAERENI